MKKIISLCLCLFMLLSVLSGCNSKSDSESSESTSENSTQNATAVEADFSKTDADMFTERDLDASYDETNAVKIELTGNSATSTSDSVKISDSTITITQEATYIVTGTLKDGMIIVDAPDTAKPQIVLNQANITSSTSAPIYVKQANKVFVTLVGENTLANGGTFTAIDDNNIDSVIFSKQDLTLNGSGSLNITSPVGHGIVGKDDLVFTGGTYSIASASHAVDANNSVRIKEAGITASAGKDGIHCENTDDTSKGFVYIASGTMKIESEGDGISASAYMQINNGTFNILAGGGYENGSKEHSDNWGGFAGGGMPGGGRPGQRTGETSESLSSESQVTAKTLSTTEESESSSSMKGLKATNSILVENGTFTINSADDAVHSDVSVIINSGTFEIASGDDAIHAEEELTITNGKINITNSYEGPEALNIAIKGGEIKLVATDDGLNAAGGTDQSGMGGRDTTFSEEENQKGGGKPGGGMSSNSNGSIAISGGTLSINASGDGIDANGSIEISGGYTTVEGPTQGDTATLDYDSSAAITGGTFVGTGASNMAQSFSNSDQGVIAVSVGNQSANTKITLKDENGNELISHSPTLSFQIIILSSPDIKSGETYTVTVGTQSQDFQAS